MKRLSGTSVSGTSVYKSEAWFFSLMSYWNLETSCVIFHCVHKFDVFGGIVIFSGRRMSLSRKALAWNELENILENKAGMRFHFTIRSMKRSPC